MTKTKDIELDSGGHVSVSTDIGRVDMELCYAGVAFHVSLNTSQAMELSERLSDLASKLNFKRRWERECNEAERLRR